MKSTQIHNVRERLRFVTALTAVRDHFRGMDKIEDIGNSGWTHPYRHFSALRFYLLLTCFDVLGSTKDFIPFSNWLRSSNTEEEREQIFSLCTFSNPQDFLTEVHDKYNAIYGVRVGFVRFIEHLLSAPRRTALLDSINVRKISEGREDTSFRPTDKRKIDFMFSIRNVFTHEGESIAAPDGGIFQDDGDGYIINGKLSYGFRTIYHDKRKTFHYEYSVRRWPDLLVEILEQTITEAEQAGA